MTKRTLAQLFRELKKIEAQIALLRLDLQAAGVLPKPVIAVELDKVEPNTSGTQVDHKGNS